MRDELLSRGPDALVDYGLLEMLLFFAMPNGETKPLAKALINQFGSFADVVAAPPDELLSVRGLGVHSVAAIKLVQAAAVRLSRTQVLDQRALDSSATALILVHNRPSGDSTPSRQDIEMTREVEGAGKFLSVVLHDRIIVGKGKWTSFRQHGFL